MKHSNIMHYILYETGGKIMLNKNDIKDIFGNEVCFPQINSPIAYNGNSDKLTDYLIKLANDETFLNEEAEKIGEEVVDILKKLEDEGIINE